MSSFWVDANILLRLITKEPAEQLEQVLQLARAAEAGQVRLKLASVVLGEIVWVLTSFYRYSKAETAETLLALVTSGDIESEEPEVLARALHDMAAKNVDFIDAYLAATASARGESVVSFDRDFDRLNVRRFRPGELTS